MLINSSVQGLSFFIIDCLVVGLASWYLMGLFGADQLFERFILFTLISSALIIFSTYVLSLMRQIQPFGYLMFHTVLFSGVFFLVKKRFTGLVPQTIIPFRASEIKKHPLIGMMGMALGVFLITSLFLGFFVPPNNWDSMSYHLSRVGYWLQNKTLASYLVQDTRQIYLLPNAEILLLWPIVFLKSDVLAFLPQWISYVGVMFLVFLIARHLNFSLFPSLFSAYIWASCTEVMLEATTTQNDLVLTFFLTAGVYFFLKGLRDHAKKMLFASAIAFGIAFGTKGIALFILPGLLLCSIIYVYAGYPLTNDASAHRREGLCAWSKCDGDWYFLRSWFFYAVSCFIVLGSYRYVQNFFQYGFPLGPKVILDTHSTFSISNMAKNLVFITWRFFDSSGLTFLRIPGFYHGASFHEDSAGYGLAWLFFCLPALVYFIYRILTRNIKTVFLVIFSLGFFFSFCAALFKNPWYFRLLIPFTALVAPLCAVFYPGGLSEFSRRKARFFYCTFFLLTAVLQMMTVAFCNPSKPLFVLPFLQKNKVFNHYTSVLQMDSHEMRYLPFSDLKLAEMDIYRELDRVAKPYERIGIIVSGNDWDYPAFGDHFQRLVFPIIYSSAGEVERLAAAKQLDYVIIFGPAQKFENFHVDLEPLIRGWLHAGPSSPFVLLKNSGDLYLFGVKRRHV